MKVPRQIIYPLRYVRPRFARDAAGREACLLDNLERVIGPDGHYVILGRARTGLYLFARQFITKTRNKVILSPYTIPDVVNMIKFAGGLPVFVDSRPSSTNVDVDQLESLISDTTACVMLTHYHVNQNEFFDIRALCERAGVSLFEDCAISMGGTINGIPVGLGSHGGVFSLSSFKFLNYIWGGVIFTGDASLARLFHKQVEAWPRLRNADYRAQVLRTLKYDLSTRPIVFTFITGPLLCIRQGRSGKPIAPKRYRIESTSLDATLTSRPIAAALSEWNRKTGDLEKHLQHRRRISSIYDERLDELMVSSETTNAIRGGSCYVNYPIYVGRKRRDRIYKELLLAGFDVGLSHYPNAHTHPEFRAAAGYSEHTMDLVDSVITLPTHPRTPEVYAAALAKRLTEFI